MIKSLNISMENFKAPKDNQFSLRDLFSFEGRIRRRHYWIISLLSGFVFGLFQTIQQYSDSIGITILFLIIYAFYAWIIFATEAKRCHDLGDNGWWQLIPFYNLWFAFQNSQSGDNEYGPNPKGE